MNMSMIFANGITKMKWQTQIGALLVVLAAAFSAHAQSTDTDLSSDEIAEIEARLQQQLRDTEASNISLEKGGSAATLLSDDQPDWLTLSPSEYLANHKRSVASELFFSKPETKTSLDDSVRQAVRDYVNGYLGDDKASYLVRFDDSYIKNRLVKEEFEEVWEVKQFGRQMYRRHALVDFNDDFRADLQAKWGEVTQTSKVLTAGLGGG